MFVQALMRVCAHVRVFAYVSVCVGCGMRVWGYGCDHVHTYANVWYVCVLLTSPFEQKMFLIFKYSLFNYITDNALFAPLVNVS